MWFVVIAASLAQDPDTEVETDPVLDASMCGLKVTREVPPTIETALPAGSAGCSVEMTVDERGRVSAVGAVDCPSDVVQTIRPDLEKWRFERTDCPVDDPLSFVTTFETDSQTWLIPESAPVDTTLFNAPEGTEGCVMVVTLLPDGSVENVRASDAACTLSVGASGWNPERFWKDEIEGLRCQATFEARQGHVNRVGFTGCAGPSRMALVSFVERASWASGSDEPVPFDVRFRMRDDESEPLERASQEARYIRRPQCEEPDAPGFLARKTRIPAMPARWALDQSELAAYCRLRVHLGADAVPQRIDAVLCNGVYGPRAASAVTDWRFEAPTCNGTPIESEVVVVVPFAKRVGGSLQQLMGGEAQTIDLVASTMSRRSELDHCELWIDMPTDGRVRIQSSDPDNCYVTPNSVPSIPRRKLIKWANMTDEWRVDCDSTFTAHTMSVDEPELGTCYLGTRDLAREGINDWSWSVLGRESQKYTVHWQFRLD